jgi:outer membrane receptor protein involved in Fe transport
MRRILVVIAVFAIAQTRYAGRPLTDVLREMQQRGLNIIYSNDLVKPDARVISEPRATKDRQILDEILAPHGLAAKDGPDRTILIVRARSPRREPTPAATVAAPAPAAIEMPVSLAQIVVTASEYPVLGNSPEHRQFLSRQEVNRTPHLGDDIFRALSRLPGASSNDFSASFGVRGGTPDDVLVLIDGLQITQPFHMRYFQNVISVVDSEAIGSLDFLSGGAPVEYGDRMSGVIDMATASPSAMRTYAGASFTHARLLSAGTFAGDRGQWLFSARRGYFDLVLDLFYNDVSARPRYGDVIGKLQYRIGVVGERPRRRGSFSIRRHQNLRHRRRRARALRQSLRLAESALGLDAATLVADRCVAVSHQSGQARRIHVYVGERQRRRSPLNRYRGPEAGLDARPFAARALREVGDGREALRCLLRLPRRNDHA